VYYIQYAHARICAILAKLGSERVSSALGVDATWTGEDLQAAERDLAMKLLALPGEISEAAERRAPHRIANYALELAQQFSAFYRDCKVVGAEPVGSESFRIAISAATRDVLALVLGLLGVSAPEHM
ncbi:MAG: arginine--tRNA ligase, partial [Solirubrobacterales bacterium]|nr:arginine--tRNA ligase [Solirubrobacterales bacterium]